MFLFYFSTYNLYVIVKQVSLKPLCAYKGLNGSS